MVLIQLICLLQQSRHVEDVVVEIPDNVAVSDVRIPDTSEHEPVNIFYIGIGIERECIVGIMRTVICHDWLVMRTLRFPYHVSGGWRRDRTSATR